MTGHLSPSGERGRSTPPEWLQLGAALGELVNEWAGRSDIVTRIGPNAGASYAACWIPAIAEVEVNTAMAFGEKVTAMHVGDLSDPRDQYEQPVAMGATLHESMHARHTLWPLDFDFQDRRVADLTEWFEESRIEARGVKRYPRYRSWLRASALKLALGDMTDEDEERASASHAMLLSRLTLLSLARVDAGVLEERDVERVRRLVAGVFGEPLLEKLREVWVAAHAHVADADPEPLADLAREWLRLLKEAGHDTEPTVVEITVTREQLDELLKELGEAADATEIGAHVEAGQEVVRQARERAAAAARERQSERAEARKERDKAFGASMEWMPTHASKSRLVKRRPPTPAERGAAVVLARELDKARYRDREKRVANSVMPPGRIRSAAAMQADAVTSMGGVARAQPFRQARRRMVEDPTLRIGVMVDISGSMSKAMEPMAAAAWILSEAGRRIQARVAMVYFGNDCFPVLRAGQHLSEVQVWSASDSVEKFNRGFLALEGELQLLDSSGARLLVVVSDLIHSTDEKAAELRWMSRCRDAGVGVMVLPYEARGSVSHRRHAVTAGAQVVEHPEGPVTGALEIGRAARRALERASA